LIDKEFCEGESDRFAFRQGDSPTLSDVSPASALNSVRSELKEDREGKKRWVRFTEERNDCALFRGMGDHKDSEAENG
jgi:hypothetical protein